MQRPAHYTLGDFEIAMISDGHMKLDAGAVMGLIPRVMWEPIVGAGNLDAEYRIPLGLNCMVVRRGDDVVLIETGMGDKHAEQVRTRVFPGDYGYLMASLGALDLTPDDITAVINTHLHADHCGWNTVRRGGAVVPAFPRARYFVAKGEYEAALHPNERTKGTYFPENVEPLAATGQLELVEGSREVVAGIQFHEAPGHTADHAVVVLSSGGETGIYLGDLVQHQVQIERLAWISAFDVMPLQSLESKRSLLARAIAENALLISCHNPFPGVGRLKERDGRRTFVTE
ncbi:MAG: MBL fold metallo-hydrolase [Dehalococcoidia bacterium]